MKDHSLFLEGLPRWRMHEVQSFML